MRLASRIAWLRIEVCVFDSLDSPTAAIANSCHGERPRSVAVRVYDRRGGFFADSFRRGRLDRGKFASRQGDDEKHDGQTNRMLHGLDFVARETARGRLIGFRKPGSQKFGTRNRMLVGSSLLLSWYTSLWRRNWITELLCFRCGGCISPRGI